MKSSGVIGIDDNYLGEGREEEDGDREKEGDKVGEGHIERNVGVYWRQRPWGK